MIRVCCEANQPFPFTQIPHVTHKVCSPAIVLFSLFFFVVCVCGISGCSGGSDTTVIAPTETFQEDPDVAEAKAKAMAESQKEPL